MNGSRFLKSTTVYLIGGFLSKLALFLMLPVYTAKIPVADMGVYEAQTAFAVLLSSVLFLDLGVGVLRFSLAKQEGERVIPTGLWLVFGLSLLYLGLCATVFWILALPDAPLVLLFGLANALFAVAGYLARARGRATLYALGGVVSTVVQIALNLILILGVGLGVRALYISYAVGALFGAALLLLGSVKRFCLARPDPAVARRLLCFCLPLGVSAAAYWVLTSFGRVAVTLLVGEAAGGAFGISLKFAQIIVFASLAFRLAWQELTFEGGDPDAVATARTRQLSLAVRIVFAVCLVLVPLARVALALFPRFIGGDYEAAGELIPLALVGAALTVLCDFLEPLFGAFEKTGRLLFTTALGAAVNVGLTLTLAPVLGAFGVHLALIAAMLVTLGVRLAFLRREVGLSLPWRALLLLPMWAFAVFAYLRFSALQNLFLLIFADLFGALLLLPEVKHAIRQLKKAKA